MNRRHFLWSAGAVSASFVFPKAGRLLAWAPPSDGWRTFEVKTRVEILKPSGTTRVWLPAALLSDTPFQKTLSNEFSAEGRRVVTDADQKARAGVATKDRVVENWVILL